MTYPASVRIWFLTENRWKNWTFTKSVLKGVRDIKLKRHFGHDLRYLVKNCILQNKIIISQEMPKLIKTRDT